MEAHENYQKQSWRNRCTILTSNGPEILNVPVIHDRTDGLEGTFRIPIREIRIDWSRDWLTRHKRAIDSAYMSSAYFEHYRQSLYEILERREELLWDMNKSIIDWLCKQWQLPVAKETISFGQAGTPDMPVAAARPDIHPKREDKIYVRKEYWQVFSGKFPFQANLSAMDLLFNEGPGGRDYL